MNVKSRQYSTSPFEIISAEVCAQALERPLLDEITFFQSIIRDTVIMKALIELIYNNYLFFN